MSGDEIVRTTCPRDCYDGCGIAVVKRGGRIHRVLGDRDHPVSRGALCGKCALAYNGVFRDENARLTRPLRRVGRKGEGRFEPVSWDAALEEMAGRLRAIADGADAGGADAGGAERVLHTHYTGTCSLLAGEFPMRFFNRLGATEADPDTICNNAGHVALDYVWGESGVGFDPKSARDSRCILVWGANPSHSAPHAHKHWLYDRPAGQRPKVIVVDPIRHETAAEADLHLQLFPGSDAALAFAFLHVARRDGLLDADMIAAHTLGFDELEPLIDRRTPGWAETATGVPAALVEEAARCYAEGPSLLWLGQGFQRQPRGGNAMRACAVLPAVTGNVARPGAGFCYVNGSGPRRIGGRYLAAPHLRARPAAPISHMDLADALGDPRRAAALVSWNMNVAASGPRQTALRAALAREDLYTVVIDLFQTDTADFADLVLPAASFLEFDDLVVPYFHLYVSAQVKAAEPPGEALPNQEIFRRLARRMGYTEAELFEPDRSVIDALLERSGLGIDFDRLREAGTIDPWDSPRVQHAGMELRTPSGRVEIASAAAARDGHPRLPEPHADPRPCGRRLRLLTPAGKWQLNDSYGNDANVRRTLGEPTVWLHPGDAGALAVGDGDPVRLHNETGSVAATAALSETVPRGAALAYKGRWPKLSGGANVNFLNPGDRTDLGESTAVHGVEVRVDPT